MVFAIDNSFSMRQDDRFAAAKQAALEQINAMHEDDRGQIVSFGGPARLLTDMTGDRRPCAPRSPLLRPATIPVPTPSLPACSVPPPRA